MQFYSISFCFMLTSCCLLRSASTTPLDDYINKADSSYDYSILEDFTRVVDGRYTVYLLNMTSQTWLDESKVDRTIWWHYLAVTIPDKVRYPDTGFFYITGGSNNDSPPDPLRDVQILMSSYVAVEAGVVSGCLFQIPNGPMVFKNDPKNKSRSGDSAIAFTWNHFITFENGVNEPDYLMYLPMTKAAIRGFDAMTDWVHKIKPELSLTRFFPVGGSKRGWTTWLTGAVDKRVFAMAPIVLDVLNFVENLRHHYRSLGGWSLALRPYYDEGITAHIDDPNSQLLADIIDPFAYRDRLTMPKYIISASNDEFFLPDDSHYYLKEMLGPTYIRIIPNAEHVMALHYRSLVNSYKSFMVAAIQNWTLPTMSWKRYENATHGVIELTTDQTPIEIKAWKARTLDGGRRDFRFLKIKEGNPGNIGIQPALYRSFPVQRLSATKYEAAFHRPFRNWQAFEIEAEYAAPDNSTIIFTTEMNIMPDGSFAAPECHGAECYGTIV